MKVPKALTVTKLDGIVAFGPWFTAGHIETGGDDNITAAPIGKKLMIIAKRGNPAREIELLMSSYKAVVNLLGNSPPKRLKGSVKFFVTSPDALMIQPALWAHTVVTFSTGMSLVVGFEGKSTADKQRRVQVLNYFATGMEREKRAYLLGSLSDKAMMKKLKTLRKEKTALYEQLECLQYDSKSVPVAKSKNGFITKKNRRMLNFARCRQRIQQKIATKKGKLFVCLYCTITRCVFKVLYSYHCIERINKWTITGHNAR